MQSLRISALRPCSAEPQAYPESETVGNSCRRAIRTLLFLAAFPQPRTAARKKNTRKPRHRKELRCSDLGRPATLFGTRRAMRRSIFGVRSVGAQAHPSDCLGTERK